VEVRPHHQRASQTNQLHQRSHLQIQKLDKSEWNSPPAQLRPMNSILALCSTLEKRGDFFGKFVQEPQEDFSFCIAQMYGVKDFETHMTLNGPKLLASQRARHQIQRTVHWLEKSLIPATIDLEDTCEKSGAEVAFSFNS
jgi:hypothetical protein